MIMILCIATRYFESSIHIDKGYVFDVQCAELPFSPISLIGIPRVDGDSWPYTLDFKYA